MQYKISQLTLLGFGESLLKIGNVTERMYGTPLYFSAKIALFITYTDSFCKKVT